MADRTIENTRDRIAKKLKEAREGAGLTTRQAGEKIGKSGKTVSAWENGHGQPDAEMFLVLCEVYGVPSVNYFFSEEGPDPDRVTTADERRLLSYFRSLNAEGRAKGLAYLVDLIDTGKY